MIRRLWRRWRRSRRFDSNYDIYPRHGFRIVDDVVYDWKERGAL